MIMREEKEEMPTPLSHSKAKIASQVTKSAIYSNKKLRHDKLLKCLT